MRWNDPLTSEPREKSTGTKNKRVATDMAKQKELELSTAPVQDDRMTWKQFRTRYEEGHIANLRESTAQAWSAAAVALERKCAPDKLVDITTAMFHEFAALRKADGIAATTIAKDIRHLRGALRWAVEVNLLAACPKYKAPRKTRGRKTNMRSEPINLEQFKRMLAAVVKVRPADAAEWRRYLKGLWLSGLRAVESVQLAWNGPSGFTVDLTGEHAKFRILAEAQKGDRDELCPMAPGFEKFLLKTPKKQRTGFVFFGGRFQPSYVKRMVSAIGRKSGVLVDRNKEAFAGSHTLRRSFGTRWARKVFPPELQALMRHKNIATTMEFYVGMKADEVNRSIRRRRKQEEK